MVEEQVIAWPTKTRELQNIHMDSTIWNDFVFRADDIIISTYGKSGTTWMQQIVSQLVFGGQDDVNVAALSPWLDSRDSPKQETLAAIEAQTHRRFLKTHLPVDALVFSLQAKYIYMGRDGRDIVWSFHNHHFNYNETLYRLVNDAPDRPGPPLEKAPKSVVDYFQEWLEKDGYPFWPFWENVRSWWAIRHLPNVKLMHYNNFLADMPSQIREVAQFLDIPIDDVTWNAILKHTSFDHMKQHADRYAPMGGVLWTGGGKTFIHKGTNGRWREQLSDELSQRYEQRACEELGEACAHWLQTGVLGER